MQYVQCLVHKGAEMKLPVVVPPWEVPILEVKFGEVETNGFVEGVDREVNAQDEYHRLVAKHGRDNETKQSFVQLAFGQDHEGRLKVEIEKAKKAEAKRKAAGGTAEQLAGDDDKGDANDGAGERDEIKAQLDDLGVEYNPNSQIKTLKKTLDEALALINQDEEDAA